MKPHRRYHHTLKAGFALSLLLAWTPASAQLATIFNDVTATNLPTLNYENGMDVEAADIDKDGDLDLIIANEFQPNVILINDGKGSFTNGSAGRIAQVIHDSEDIAVADFDGDGDLDIVFVSEDDNVHEYHQNDGTGTFTHLLARLPASTANAVAVADLTNDGKPDLVVGNAGQDFLLVNDGTGKFVDESSTRLPAEENVTQDVELADIDKDGDLDMVVGNEDGNKILVNDGSGKFADETSSRLMTDVDMETRKVALADIDKDGDLDIFMANVAFRPGKNPNARFFVNDGRGFFADETTTRLPQPVQHTIDGKLVDIDYDGDVDLITGHFPQKPIRALLNDGTGKFIESSKMIFSAVTNSDALGLELVDVNGDGLLDLYVCNRGQKDRLYLHASNASSIDQEPSAEWPIRKMDLTNRN